MFSGVTSPGNVTASTHLMPSAGQAATLDVRQDLNFSDPQALMAERQRLIQVPALVRFCNEAFTGVGDSTEAQDAVVTLILAKRARDLNLSTAPIGSNFDALRMMLTERLSQTGKAALLQTLNVTVGGNGFSEYFAASDRFLMAGWACLAQGDVDYASGDLESAAKIYLKAAHAFKLAGRQASAAEAYLRAAEASAGEPAAKAYWDSAGSLMEAGQPVAAAYRYLKAVHIYLEVGKPELAEQAAQMASSIFEAQGQLKQAAEALALTKGIMGFPYRQAEPPEKTIAEPESLNTHLYEKPDANSTSPTPSSATAKLNNTEPKLKQAYADETNKAQSFLNDYNVTRAVADGLLDANFGEPRTLSVDDIIPPENLKDLVPYKDFVLLMHNAPGDTLDAIKKDGIKSLKCLAEDANSPEKLKSLYKSRVNDNKERFANDPNLIYFSLVRNISNISDNKIIIAVKTQSVFVFDQENRARSSGTARTYRGSAMSLKTYLEAVANCPTGSILDCNKGYTPNSVFEFREKMGDYISYVPECCFPADRIDPKFFFRVLSRS